MVRKANGRRHRRLINCDYYGHYVGFPLRKHLEFWRSLLTTATNVVVVVADVPSCCLSTLAARSYARLMAPYPLPLNLLSIQSICANIKAN